ncbi:MAG: hypothetical protein V3R99_01245 [Thermoguttaceae bacterium]
MKEIRSHAFGRSLPTVSVLALLIVLGTLGHRAGWRIPKFSELIGQTPPPEEDWCDAHNVPESQCISCRADLMPKPALFGWCQLHGVHECPLCHPEVAQLKELPEPGEADSDRAAGALQFTQRQENNRRCQLHLRRIQFMSAEAVDRAGIDIDLVDTAPVVESVWANGKITYDRTRVTHLSTRVPGNV